MSELRDAIINDIINREGGYVNDPADSGGETMYGITEAVARHYGYEGEMEDMPREVAEAIYANLYWNPLHLTSIETMSELITEELADTAVNQGVKRAATFLQRSLNVLNNRGELYIDLIIDGDVGPATLRALGEYLGHRGQEGEQVLHRMLNSLQGAFYVELAERREKDEKFIYGWYRARVS
ncbi:MAG: hypothetical protein HUJ30_08420 [Gammaproteobacteria bacterium]|nr:hypothetical protein [Gammaproteobacteria bacterium]